MSTGSTDGICSGLHRSWHPKKLGKFQRSKECADNRQELLAGMVYWSRTNGIKIDTDLFFVKLEIEEMVKIKFNPGGPVAIYGSSESGISPFMAIPRTTQEIEEEIRREEVEAES